MSPRDDSRPMTRAERRRRMLDEQWQPEAPEAPEPATGAYDPHPYGVHAYPDIEDAVVEEYVEDAHPAPTPAAYDVVAATLADEPTPAPYDVVAAALRDEPTPAPYDVVAADLRDEPSPAPYDVVAGSIEPEAYGAAPAPYAPGESAGPRPTEPEPPGPPRPAAPPAPESRHVAHRAYGSRVDGAQPPASGPDRAPATVPVAPPPPTSVPAAERAVSPEPPTAPSPEPAADQPQGDVVADAATLQLLAARAAAERLVGPARTPSAASARAAGDAERAREERARLAAERIAADRVAAARKAAVRAAAAGRPATRPALPAGPAPAAGGPAGRGDAQGAARQGTAAGSGASGSGATGSGASGSGATGATPPAAPPAAPARRPKARRTSSRRARLSYAAAALLVLAGGIAVSAPKLGAVLTSSPLPSPTDTAPTSAAPEPSGSPSASPGASTAAGAPNAVPSTMACDPAPWVSKLADEPAAAEFTPSSLAQAYCLTAGTLRSVSFTDLAVRRSGDKPYTAADFAPIAPHLSPALKSAWDKDVAELVKTQDVSGAAGRRISALTRLAWDNGALKFDPSAPARADGFVVGRPVTWTAKGSDGTTRLGLGFETGLMTHMVDGSGRKQEQALKRTYRLELVKGAGDHPWLIDGYQVSEVTAALATTTSSPTAPASTSAATTRS